MRPQVIAHRGGAALAPENTMPAFEQGLALGADGVELDVHLSRDGVVVVHHDPAVERTTDGSGPVAGHTAAELGALDAGYRFGRDGLFPFRGLGIGVPTLGEVLARFPHAHLLVELKTGESRLAAAVVHEIRAAQARDRVTIGSFHQGALDAVRQLDPTLRTGADMDDIKAEVTSALFGSGQRQPAFHSFQVPEVYAGNRIVTPEFITRVHGAGVAVIVWTVDQEADILRLLNWGVDGIITDRPDIAVPVVRDWYESSTRSREPEASRSG